MSPAAPEATNRASTAPRSDGVARLVGRGGEVATATGRTPRRSMQTRRRLPDGGQPGKRASKAPTGHRARPGRLEPLLPTGKKSGRPPRWSKRQLINGIRWRTRTGAPWRDVPARYGPWQTVYGLFRRWQRDGTWQQILTALQAQADAKGLITWEVSVDSTVARAHQHAAGARKGGTGNAKNRAESTSNPPITPWGAPEAG